MPLQKRYHGNQQPPAYYNPGNQWAMSNRNPSGETASFEVKAGKIGVKYKGDPESSLAQAAVQIAYMAVTSQARR
jgi:hypothetical protein